MKITLIYNNVIKIKGSPLVESQLAVHFTKNAVIVSPMHTD